MTASFETRPSGTTIAKKALRSSIDAFGKMKPLFLSAIAISLATGFATFYVPHFRMYIFKPQELSVASDIFRIYAIVELVSILAWTAVAVPAAVAVHRFILLGQTTSRLFSFGPRYTKSFFLWAVGLQAIWAVSYVLPHLFVGERTLIGGLIALVFDVLILIISIHLAMIFPAVATEAPNEHWWGRVVKSWEQMRGHSWLLVRAILIAFLPWLLVYFVFWIFLGGLRASRFHGDLQYSSRLGLALLIGGFRIPLVMLGAAVASWLYAWVRQTPGSRPDPEAHMTH